MRKKKQPKHACTIKILSLGSLLFFALFFPFHWMRWWVSFRNKIRANALGNVQMIRIAIVYTQKFHQWPLTQCSEYQLFVEFEWIGFITFSSSTKTPSQKLTQWWDFIIFGHKHFWIHIFEQMHSLPKENETFWLKVWIEKFHILFKWFEDFCN